MEKVFARCKFLLHFFVTAGNAFRVWFYEHVLFAFLSNEIFEEIFAIFEVFKNLECDSKQSLVPSRTFTANAPSSDQVATQNP